jgi:serine/threonine-protein kinase RsbW
VHVTREFSSDPGELSAMREFLRHAFRQAWPDEDGDHLQHLELALQEAASNIMRHAYGGERERGIELTIDADAETIQIELLHEGEPFDATKAPPPVFDGSREGGFGCYLISASVDRVEYLHNLRGKNGIRLWKHRRPGEHDGDSASDVGE